MPRVTHPIVFLVDYNIFKSEAIKNAVIRAALSLGRDDDVRIRMIYNMLLDNYGDSLTPEIIVRAFYYYYVEKKKLRESILLASREIDNPHVKKALLVFNDTISKTLKLDSTIEKMFIDLSSKVKLILIAKTNEEPEVKKFVSRNNIPFGAIITRPDLSAIITEISIKTLERGKKIVYVLFTTDKTIIPLAKQFGMLTVYKKKFKDEIVKDSQEKRPHYTICQLQDFAKIYREVYLK